MKDEVAKEEEVEVEACDGCGEKGAQLHQCPYERDICNDPVFSCHCCGVCERACSLFKG